MRPNLFIFLIAAGLSLPGIARQNQSEQEKDTNRAIISFEQTTLDLGEIPYSSKGNCWFHFQNTGKSPLILTSVMTTCDCAASSWPRKPVLPGKKDSIRVIYNTNTAGFFSKTLEVWSNAKNSPTILTVKGKIITNKFE